MKVRFIVLEQLLTKFYLSIYIYIYIYVSIYLWLYSPLLDLGRLSDFLYFTPWTGHQPVARHTQNSTNRINAQTSMPRVGFEPVIPVFEGAKTVNTLDRAATVIVCHKIMHIKL
jgi:hypothetical protein